jgi:hypothetical protein
MSKRNQSEAPIAQAAKPVYESPKIEEIVTPAELEREVHYAGRFSV